MSCAFNAGKRSQTDKLWRLGSSSQHKIEAASRMTKTPLKWSPSERPSPHPSTQDNLDSRAGLDPRGSEEPNTKYLVFQTMFSSYNPSSCYCWLNPMEVVWHGRSRCTLEFSSAVVAAGEVPPAGIQKRHTRVQLL